ncbi:MAG: transcriptional repressor [Anaerolineales bacterium]|nr:transcriptional repressor [Anaerolineales bacterium]
MTHDLLNYHHRLRSSGHRVTPQRKAILDAICEAGGGMTTEDILLRLRKKNPRLNRATVYRNLSFLQNMHLVESSGSGKSRTFEISSLNPRHRQRCRVCGEEIDLDCKYVRRLKQSIFKDLRFEIDDHHLSFLGICRRCQSENRKSLPAAEILK